MHKKVPSPVRASAPATAMIASSSRQAQAQLGAFLGGQLLESVWVRRLRKVSFLGTLDLHPKSRRVSSRYEHVLGVAMLGLELCRSLDIQKEDARHFVAACLLHDVGHFPWSHAAEPAFLKRLGADHHRVGEWIVKGQGAIPARRSLRALLEGCALDPERVWAFVEGHEQNPRLGGLGELLRAPINLDTLDGICRVARDFRLSQPKKPPRLFCWYQGEIAIDPEALAFTDRFWALKDRVYEQVIHLPSNILAEARLCEEILQAPLERVFERFDGFDDERLQREIIGARSSQLIRAAEDRSFQLRAQPGWGELMTRMRKRYRVAATQHAWDQQRQKKPDTKLESKSEIDPEDLRPLPLRRWGQRYLHHKERVALVARRQQLDLPKVFLNTQAPEL